MGLHEMYPQPDGGVVEIDREVLRALNDGYPPLGWEGDPRLYLAWNRATSRMELWRNCEDGKHRMILRSRPGVRVVDMNLIHWIVTHDPHRGYDAVADMQQHNANLQDEALMAQRDKMGEAADRIRHGFQKDTGAHLTGDSADNFLLPDAPWKKDK